MTAHPWTAGLSGAHGNRGPDQGRAWQTGMFYRKTLRPAWRFWRRACCQGIRSWTLVRRREENLLLRL